MSIQTQINVGDLLAEVQTTDGVTYTLKTPTQVFQVTAEQTPVATPVLATLVPVPVGQTAIAPTTTLTTAQLQAGGLTAQQAAAVMAALPKSSASRNG